MTDKDVTPQPVRSLRMVAAARDSFSLQETLGILRAVTRQMSAFHVAHRLHGAIDLDAIEVEPPGKIRLRAVDARRTLGGPGADPDYCPPELQSGAAVTPPAPMEEARKTLRQAGYDVDPRRIDIYQIGALGVRLLCGESVSRYLSSPKIHAKVPPHLAEVLEQALGYNPHSRLSDGESLLTALDQAREPSGKASTVETPGRGTSIEQATAPPSSPPREHPKTEMFEAPAAIPFQKLGQFEILSRIGRGGMGDVYRALDTSLKRHVAIKVLPLELARSEDLVRRFHAEAAAAAKLAHPNIVPIHFIGQDAGHHYFAMQFVDGDSLADRLSQQPRLPPEETVAIAGQCLAALEAAHAHGLIHRDVKPGNILLDRQSGRAMLADFGLVHSLGDSQQMTATGVIMGTVDYIAPEQARGQRVDGRSDLYSLGVLMYRMLAGRLPFEAETPTAMIFQHAYEQPRPLREVAPDVPAPLAAIVARLMAKNPDERYANCRAVLADLDAFKAGKPLAAGSAIRDKTAIMQASEIGLMPMVSSGSASVAKPGLWGRVKDVFWQQSPQFVRELQSTSHQIDRTIAEYGARRNELAQLVQEAEKVAADFVGQAVSHRLAAAEAARDAQAARGTAGAAAAQRKADQAAQVVANLEAQQVDQQRQAAELQQRLSEVDSQLGSLRTQREALRSRLEAAETRWKMAGGKPARRPRWIAIGIAAGTVSALTIALLFLLIPSSQDPKPVGTETVSAAASDQTGSGTPIESSPDISQPQ